MSSERPGRILGIDVGTKRMGVAVSDPTRVLASALEVREVAGAEQDIRYVIELCERMGVTRVVVGIPYSMNGSSSDSTRMAEDFACRLEAALGQPIVRWDERLSTVSAERVLIEGDMRRQRRKLLRDKVAAQILLQNYLDSLKWRL